MKKTLVSITLVLCILLLSGCGNKDSLTCTKKEENTTGITANMSIKYTFKDDTLYKITEDNEFILDDGFSSILNLTKSSLESTYDSFSDAVDYKISSKDNKLNVKSSYVVSELSSIDKIGLNMLGADTTYEDIKETKEEEGYTCK